MATFKVVPDKRYKRKDYSHRYCLRATVNSKVYYTQLKFSLTEKQHDQVFENKTMDKKTIDFREQINVLEIKAQRIYNSMRKFEYSRFKLLFYSKDKEVVEVDSSLPETLKLNGIFNFYIDNKGIKYGTKTHMHVAKRKFDEFHQNVYVDDIDIMFLQKFEKHHLAKGKSVSTISSYLRDLRTVLNYFRNVKRIIPNAYLYPFGQGGYSIKSHRKKKSVLSNDEILRIIEIDKFDSPKQEYARNIWLTLYYGCGINPIDLLKLRTKNIEGDHANLIRTKTETTRKTNVQELGLPLTDELKYYLNKVCDPTSPFVLGKLKEGFTEISLRNRKNRFRNEINPELRKIRENLNLSAPLLMATARDCYASSLRRSGVSVSDIGDMLGHNDPRTTLHYLDSLSIDESFVVNNKLVKRKKNDKGDESPSSTK